MFRDGFINFYLFHKNFLFKNIFKRMFGTFKINLDNYKLIIFDEFNKQKIDLWNVLSNIKNVKFTNSGLELYKNSKVESTQTFNMGTFEFNIELPIGKDITSSISLNTDDNCSITIMEAKSNSFGNYHSDITPHVEYGIYGLNNNIIYSNRTLIYNELELKTFYINIKCFLSNNKLSIYYNNYKVYSITDKKILKYFKNKKFNISYIINNQNNKKSKLLIKNFSYYEEIETIKKKNFSLISIMNKI